MDGTDTANWAIGAYGPMVTYSKYVDIAKYLGRKKGDRELLAGSGVNPVE
jgi:hypothetical protein